jgi:LCP family protein required for cell wall assembly
MPPRRDQSPNPSSPASPRRSRRSRRKGLTLPSLPSLPPLPRPTLQDLGRAGLLLLGLLIGGSLLDLVWRNPDPGALATTVTSPATLALKPSRPITVLVIGLDAERFGEGANQAAPAGRANADALMLVRVNPKGPLQVLNLPIEAAVNLPGESHPISLGAVYQRGGAALTAELARELTGLEPPRPDRFLVLSRSAMRRIVDAVGGLEISPPRVMRYRDKAQKYSIDLQSGLQRLDGRQVEQLVRYRDPGLGESARRRDHQLVQTGLRERFGRPDQLLLLPDLLRSLQGQVETNLTAAESLSLLAAGLDDPRPIQFATLPLRPPPKPEPLPEELVQGGADSPPKSPTAGLWQLEPLPPGKAIWADR